MKETNTVAARRRRFLLRLEKKMALANNSIPLGNCKGLTGIKIGALVESIGKTLYELCQNECFLEDFLHILETSDGTPRNHLS